MPADPAYSESKVDPARIEERLRSGYCDLAVRSLDDALRTLDQARSEGKAIFVGLTANCADVIPELAARGVVPDIVTDQTSAHDPLNGCVPNGMRLGDALELRRRNSDEYVRRAKGFHGAASEDCGARSEPYLVTPRRCLQNLQEELPQ